MARRQCSSSDTLRVRSDRNGKALRLLCLQRFGLEEWNHLIENRSVAGGANVMRGDEREAREDRH